VSIGLDIRAVMFYLRWGMLGERGPAARTDPAFRGWLRELRERAGLTQDQLAAAVGTDRRNIRRWEVEGHDPAGTMLLRILDAVGVRVLPGAPSELPRAVNVELRDLQRLLYELDDRAARRHDALVAQLEALAEAARARRAERPTTPG
jgi:transcriptional regulator with XRE-family HTH domain